MDDNLASMHEKIDHLSATVASQQERLDLLESNNGNAHLLEKINFLVEQAEAQQHQRMELEELKRDVLPIANQMIKLTIDELAEVGTEFQGEDLLFLVKRLLRDTHMIVEGLNRLEMMMELFDEIKKSAKVSSTRQSKNSTNSNGKVTLHSVAAVGVSLSES